MYSSHNYVGPGWNNSAPPPLNADNLQDISSALEDLNITQEQLETVGASGTLGEILTTNYWEKITQGIVFRSGYTTIYATWKQDSGGKYFEFYESCVPKNGNIYLDGLQKKYFTTNPQTGWCSGMYYSPNSAICYKINDNSVYTNNAGTTYSISNVQQASVGDVSSEIVSDIADIYPHNDFYDEIYFYKYLGIPIVRATKSFEIIEYIGTGTGTPLSIKIPENTQMCFIIDSNARIITTPMFDYKGYCKVLTLNADVQSGNSHNYTIQNGFLNITPNDGLNENQMIYYCVSIF